MYERAPFGLLAHDTSADPRFVYANGTAQRCFGYSWDEFVGLPSRLSARPDAQEDRDAFVRAVTVDHYATGYRGIRVGRTGRPFWIEDVTMWDLMDADGSLHGQAAVFRSWSPAKG
ncbi:MEKHLA domain-containing protein (plasmid) [Streptomyces sp. Q6]|uniref:MEKHLA domain-containing protein n=1 Tax=Streptomyces citrinus TaxID=3118173 RepID=A0ACD5AQD2_9ACTN